MHVVIPTSARSDLLQRTLRSLAACKKPPLFQKVIVIENGTSKRSPVTVPDLEFQHLHTETPGKSRALNIALDAIEEGLVVFFDDDVRLPPDILLHYARVAEEQGPTAFFGGPVDVDYEEPPPDWLVPALPGSAKGWGLNGLEREKHRWFIGSNWAAFASSLREAGGFNEQVGPGSVSNSIGQDNEMQERLHGAGFEQVFVPEAKVRHYVPKSRCSSTWMMHRAFRRGVSDGLDPIGDRTLFGIPRWWYVSLLQKLQQLIVTLAQDTRAKRFKALLMVIRHFGILKGKWLYQAQNYASASDQ